MNDTAPKAAVCATSLPYIDRRSLSEAWFSALHLASDGPTLPGARERRTLSEGSGVQRRFTARTVDALAAPVAAPPGARPRSPSAREPAIEDSRARRATSVRAPLSKRALEAARSYAPFRTSVTVGLERHRVQLLLRRDGGTLHVLALCSPAVAQIVQRALACADAHLRMRGETVRSSVHVLGTGAVRV